MRLWIVRHAVAMERDEYRVEFGSQADDEMRPLTEAGVRKMNAQAIGFKTILPRPDILISSPLTRAEQTAEILKNVWRLRGFEVCASLRPHARPDSFIKWTVDHLPSALTQDESEELDVVIVGHGPGLPILIRYLLTGDTLSESETGVELKKGGVCCLEFETAIEAGAGRLKHHLTPRVLRGLSNN